ncbi:C-type lectin lectoxin-Lio3-like [Branchiostoma floridae x Branchiostoma belcheri]
MVPPAMSKMTPAQAWLATTLPDTTTGLPQMADTQPDQSTSLPGVISTDTTDKSSHVTSTKFALQHQKETVLTTEGHLPFGRPPPFHGNTFDDATHVPRCKKGYKLLAGTCIKLVSTGWFEIGRSHYDAKKTCMKEGATLAMPKTEELDVALKDLVKREGGNHQHWIGMEKKRGTWYWVDGSVVGNNGYQGWNPGEPSNSGDWLSLCGQYQEKPSGWLSRRTGYVMWDDDACFQLKSFICQHPPA